MLTSRIGWPLLLAGTLLLSGCAGDGPAPPAAAPAKASGTLVAEHALDPVPAQPAGTPGWAPWPAALHDARHSGATSTDGPSTGIVRWRRTLEAAITPGPVVGPDGTIYAASNGGVLHALDPATGADRWTYDAHHTSGGDLSVSPLVLPDGAVLYPTPSRRLVALSPAGVPLWSMDLSGTPTSPTSADGRRVYVGDESGGVTALDVAPGGGHRKAWTLDVGSVSYGSVVTDGTGRVYTTADSALVAVDDRGATATVAWKRDPGDDITEVSAGLAPDGTALLGTNGTKEWAYHRDGGPAWTAPRVITYSSPAITATGLGYVADHTGRVHVYNVATGREVATYGPVPAQIWSSVAVDRGYRVYFGTQDGHARGIAPDGTLLFNVDLGSPIDSYPALTGDGALVIGSRGGVLTAIG